MPELPEVENVRRSLAKKVEDKTIEKVEIHNDVIIKYNDSEMLPSLLTGKKIQEVKRRGKFLTLVLDQEHVLMVHLGMTGALLHNNNGDYSVYPNTIKNHIFVELTLSDGSKLIYSDYRRFGSVRVVAQEDLVNPYISHLTTYRTMGPEPFDTNAFELFLTNIRHKRYREKPIKDVLLDQRVIAGVGNIYASECLLTAMVNPHRSVCGVTDAQLETIFNSLVDILTRSIECGGTSIKDYVDSEGVSGSFQDQLKLYNQAKCKDCGEPITVSKIKGRATYHCEACQPSEMYILQSVR